jgi:hypothetical protein
MAAAAGMPWPELPRCAVAGRAWSGHCCAVITVATSEDPFCGRGLTTTGGEPTERGTPCRCDRWPSAWAVRAIDGDHFRRPRVLGHEAAAVMTSQYVDAVTGHERMLVRWTYRGAAASWRHSVAAAGVVSPGTANLARPLPAPAPARSQAAAQPTRARPPAPPRAALSRPATTSQRHLWHNRPKRNDVPKPAACQQYAISTT